MLVRRVQSAECRVQSAECRRTKSRYKYYMNIIYNELGKNQRNI
jgi:hypothetical protein